MARGPGKGKTNNANGRPKGTPNRTTKEAKLLLEQILLGQIDNIEEAFNALKEEPGKYLDACSKMFTYVLPKKTDLTSGDEPIKQNLNVTVDTSETAETLRRLRENVGKTN
jgi:hypothetical protein